MLRVLVESRIAMFSGWRGFWPTRDSCRNKTRFLNAAQRSLRNPAGRLSSVFSRPRARCLPSRRCTVD